MDIKQLKGKAKQFAKQIEERGIVSLFDSYDENDKVGNFLKAKILGQLHSNDRGNVTQSDSDNLAFLRREEGCKHILPSVEEVESYTKQLEFLHDHKALFDKINQYYTLSWARDLYSQVDEKMLVEVVGEQPKKEKFGYAYEKKEYKQKVNDYKERLKAAKNIKKNLPDFVKKLEEELALISENEIKKLEVEQPDICEKLHESVEKEMQFRLGKSLHFSDLAKLGCKDLKKIFKKKPEYLTFETLKNIFSEHLWEEQHEIEYYGFKHNAKLMLDKLDDATVLARTMMDVYGFEKNLSLEEVLNKIRSPFSKSILNNIQTEYRKVPLSQENSNGNHIGEQSCPPEKIPETMIRFSEEFSQVDWSKLSEEDAVRKAAELSWNFVCIHPFADGNGRTSRMLIDYLLTSHGINSPIVCYGRESKSEYNGIMRQCDKNKSEPFQEWLVEKYREQNLGKKKVLQQDEVSA